MRGDHWMNGEQCSPKQQKAAGARAQGVSEGDEKSQESERRTHR